MEVPEDNKEVHKKDIANKLHLLNISDNGKTEYKVLNYEDEKESKLTSDNEEHSETGDTSVKKTAYLCDIHKAKAGLKKSKEKKENLLDDERNGKSTICHKPKHCDCVSRSSSVQLQTCFLPTLRVGKR